MGLYPKKSEYRDYTFPTDHYENRIYHVSDSHGNDTWSGLSWTKAKKTIMAAVNEARYVVGGTTISYTEKSIKSLVLVAPGHYNERVAWSGYGLDLVGCSHGVPGKDYGVSINYDQALTLADDVYVVAFGGSGNSVRNLYVSCDEAMPGITILAGDNNLIENCVIESSGGAMTYGIECNSLKGSVIRDVIIRGFATAGIHCTNAEYAIQGGIYRCQIGGGSDVGVGAHGIAIDACVHDGTFVIRDNFIDILEAAGAGIGIVVAGTGGLFVTHNFVRSHTTGYSHAGDGLMLNHESVGAGAGAGVYAVSAGDT